MTPIRSSVQSNVNIYLDMHVWMVQLFNLSLLHNRSAVLFMSENLISSVYHLRSVSSNIPTQLLLTSPDPRRPRAAAHTSRTIMKTISRSQSLFCLSHRATSKAQESKVNLAVRMCRHLLEWKTIYSDYLLQKLLTEQRRQQRARQHAQFFRLGITASEVSRLYFSDSKGKICPVWNVASVRVAPDGRRNVQTCFKSDPLWSTSTKSISLINRRTNVWGDFPPHF